MTGDRIELFGTMRHRTKVSVDDNNNFNYCFTQSYFCNLFKVRFFSKVNHHNIAFVGAKIICFFFIHPNGLCLLWISRSIKKNKAD